MKVYNEVIRDLRCCENCKHLKIHIGDYRCYKEEDNVLYVSARVICEFWEYDGRGRTKAIRMQKHENIL